MPGTLIITVSIVVAVLAALRLAPVPAGRQNVAGPRAPRPLPTEVAADGGGVRKSRLKSS
jgi:hypothetical protein